MNKANSTIIEPIKTSLNAFEIFLLFKEKPYCFFLDSSLPQERLSRYSLIGANPFLVFQSKNQEVQIIAGRKRLNLTGKPLDLLREYFNRYQVINPTSLPFVGGAVGYFSYDLNRQIERLPSISRDDTGIPDCCLGFYDWVIVCDHQENKVYAAATGLPETDAIKAQKQAAAKIKKLKRVIEGGSKDVPLPVLPTGETLLRSNFAKEDYCQALRRGIDYIYAGDIYQVNLSQRFAGEFTGDPAGLYRHLRDINPAPFAAYLGFGEVFVVSSSPERYLKVTSDLVETRPIKGTRPRGKTPEEDRALQEELINSVKDRAELVMIVDLERNDLGRVCKPGSVEVTELFTLESYATVHHLVATVVGRLAKDKDLIDLLKASFPGGSITGAPKIRAMEIIEELEPTRRNIYTGSIGYLGFDGNMDLNIAIRTMVIKDRQVYFQAGGAIVADSVPEDEYQETLDKARAMIKALNGRFG
jgi:para-aminobenzoate synthetase component 1